MYEGLQHPNIISIFELLHDDQFFYVVTELITQGNLLLDVIERNFDPERGPMTEREVRYIAKQMFLGIKELHKQGLVHSDLRLENVLIRKKFAINDGFGNEYHEIKLSDFKMAHNHNHYKIYHKDIMYY